MMAFDGLKQDWLESLKRTAEVCARAFRDEPTGTLLLEIEKELQNALALTKGVSDHVGRFEGVFNILETLRKAFERSAAIPDLSLAAIEVEGIVAGLRRHIELLLGGPEQDAALKEISVAISEYGRLVDEASSLVAELGTAKETLAEVEARTDISAPERRKAASAWYATVGSLNDRLSEVEIAIDRSRTTIGSWGKAASLAESAVAQIRDEPEPVSLGLSVVVVNTPGEGLNEIRAVEEVEVKPSRVPHEQVPSIQLAQVGTLVRSGDSAGSKATSVAELGEPEQIEYLRGMLLDTEESYPAIVAALQRKWLSRNELLRGYIAARYLEGLPPESGLALACHVPAWVAWVALVVGDDAKLIYEQHFDEILAEASLLNELDSESLTFLFFCILSGLFRPSMPISMRIVQEFLPSNAFDREDIRHQPFLNFCYENIYLPAKKNLPPQSRPLTDKAELLKMLEKELLGAADSLNPARSNFKNTFVKNYYRALCGKGGISDSLLRAFHNGEKIAQSPEEVAASVDGWDEVVGDYHNSILNRIANFLGHLQKAGSVRDELRSLERLSAGKALGREVIVHALSWADMYLLQLSETAHPAQYLADYTVECLRKLSLGVPR